MMAGSESQRVLISTNAGCTQNGSSYITYFIYQENSFRVWTDASAETWVDHKKVKKKNIAAPCTFLLPASEACSDVHLCCWWHQRCQPTKIGRKKSMLRK
jgi:hypothetical protein